MAQSITRLSGVNSLSGPLPATNIANSTLDNITTLPSAVPIGKPILLSTATASSSSSIEFTSGIDSTYDVYKFEFVNIHPSVNDIHFSVNFSTDNGSNYNVTKTTTYFRARHSENNVIADLAYTGGFDQAQSSGEMYLSDSLANDIDASNSGELFLFNPSSNVYVKHIIAKFNSMSSTPVSINQFSAGYANTTSPVNAVRFIMSSGNIDAGTIKMYGISA
jgi:hypothetical protein